MSEQHTVYPNLSWAQFELFNDNTTDAFEEMCKDLFICEYLKDSSNPHADHNNPGVEVLPILEPVRADGQPQRRISYQAKYFEKNISDAQIKHSLQEAVEHYSGRLDAIYLFCNRVISTETARYQKYANVLRSANIQLELVTNKDIFTLIRKYPRVANYFFQDRKRDLTGANNLMGNVTFASSVSELEPTMAPDATAALIQELLNEKLGRCRDDICRLEFGKLKSELESLKKTGAVDGRIQFYNVLFTAHSKEDFSDKISSLPEELKEEAYWLKGFVRNMREITIEEYAALSIETQVVTLDCLFTSQHWDWIVKLYEDRGKVASEVIMALDFHTALSFFNMGECDKAHEILSRLYSQHHEQRFYLYDICSQLHKANREYVFGKDENLVKDLLSKLDGIKEHVADQIKANAPMIAVLELQACFNLGATDKAYLDQAFTRYESYSEETKTYDGVRLFTGLCFEMAGDLERASQLFSECSWKSEETVASRYLTSLIDRNKLDELPV